MKEFAKQSECIEYCKLNNLVWFGKDINEDFAKTSLACSYDEIYNIIMGSEQVHLYEGMIVHKPLKLFLDYDRKLSESEKNSPDLDAKTKNDIMNIINAIRELLPVVNHVYILKSLPDTDKKSYHLVFDGCYFSNHKSMKNFIIEKLYSKFKELFDGKIMDTSVYRQGFFRGLLCSKYGQTRPLYLLNTEKFLQELKEEIIPKTDITLELFKKTCVGYITPEDTLFNYKSENKKQNQNKKLHLVNDGDIYSDKEIIRKYLDILDSSRFVDRSKWLNIGYILYSIGSDNDDLWHYFSSKWENYNERDCDTAWHSFCNGEYIYTIHSLMHLAKLDNVLEYEEVSKEIPFHDMKYLRPFDNVISKFIYRLYGEKFVCSNPEKNEWYYFNGIRWIKENKSFNLRRLIINEVFIQIENYRKQLIKEGANEELIKNYYRILEKISSGQKMNCLELEFYNHNFYKIIDQNKDLIGFENGIYDLNTMEFRRGNPSDYVSMTTGYEYIQYEENHPAYIELMELIKKILPKEDVREFTLKALSSCLDGHIRDENFYIWSGKNNSGGNGKSTIMDLLLKSLGDYACMSPVTLLTTKRESANSANSALANIRNKRAVIMQEPESTEQIQAGVMKSLTGGDRISTRELHSSQIEFRPSAKLFMATNRIPTMSDIDGGVIRRLKIIEFISRFVENPNPDAILQGIYEFKVDKDLKAKLEKYSGVFMCILLNYYKKYRQEGLTPPDPVISVTKKYENDNNLIKQFIDENVVCGNKSDFITKDELKTIFRADFTLKNNFGKFQNFINQLENALCVEFTLDKKKVSKIIGFKIKQEEQEDIDTDDENDDLQ